MKDLTGPELKRMANSSQSDLSRLRENVIQRLRDVRSSLLNKLATNYPELDVNQSIVDFFSDSMFYLTSAENDHDPVLFGRYNHYFQLFFITFPQFGISGKNNRKKNKKRNK